MGSATIRPRAPGGPIGGGLMRFDHRLTSSPYFFEKGCKHEEQIKVGTKLEQRWNKVGTELEQSWNSSVTGEMFQLGALNHPDRRLPRPSGILKVGRKLGQSWNRVGTELERCRDL